MGYTDCKRKASFIRHNKKSAEALFLFARYLLLAFVIVVFVSRARLARICTVRAFRCRRRSTRPARVADVSRRFGFFLLVKEE